MYISHSQDITDYITSKQKRKKHKNKDVRVREKTLQSIQETSIVETVFIIIVRYY